MTWLAGLTGVDVELLRALAALCSLATAVFTGLWTLLGILNRRLRKAAANDAAATKDMVEALVQAFGVAKPEEIARLAREAAAETAAEALAGVDAKVDAKLAPVHQFFAALETVEHRREHRPETDILRILEGQAA